MKRVQIILDKRKKLIPHFIQPLSGFLRLSHDKKISLSIRHDADIDIPVPNTFAARIDDQLLYFDLSDGSAGFLTDEHIDHLRENDIVLFKRSYERSLYGGMPFIRPLGLNYPGDFTSFFRKLTLHYIFREGCIARLAERLYATASFDEIWSMRRKKRPASNGKVILCTRLWERGSCSCPVDDINRTRIEAVRAVRGFLNERAIAGVYDSRTARDMCPELILPAAVSNRNNYLELMCNASICIATTGLHRSTGWRFAEYVASGKAIISEPLFFEPTGDLQEKKNYLTFSTVNQLLTSIDRLLSHPQSIREMEKENLNYYYRYLRPDMLIHNSIMNFL